MRVSKQARIGLVSRKIVECLLSGQGINEIARALHVGKARIRKVREAARMRGYLDGSRPLPPYPELLFPRDGTPSPRVPSKVDELLDPHVPWIQDRLAAQWHAITIFEELPVRVNRSSFYRFLKRHGLFSRDHHIPRVIPEIVHRPGEALQVDWGKVATVLCPVTGKRLTVWAFVGVLGYSRYRMVRLTTAQDLETTLSLIESMLDELGGVPSKITSDNPKVFALKACRYDPLINPVYERFAAYYGLRVECLPPADPKKKGKVERPMPFIRRLFEAFTGDWTDLKVAQSFIDKQLTLANDRRHGTTGDRPVERLLTVEAAALKALPKTPWQREEYHEGTVRKDGHIRFRGKYYSLNEQFVGAAITVIANHNLVWLYHGGVLVETHARCHDPMNSKVTKKEHLKAWERAMDDTSVYRARAQTIGPHVDELVLRIIGNGLGVIDFRKVWGLLTLDKSHSAEAIDDACRQTLELGSTRLRTVRELLALRTRQGSVTTASEEYPLDLSDKDVRARNHRYTHDIKKYGAIVAQATRQ